MTSPSYDPAKSNLPAALLARHSYVHPLISRTRHNLGEEQCVRGGWSPATNPGPEIRFWILCTPLGRRRLDYLLGCMVIWLRDRDAGLLFSSLFISSMLISSTHMRTQWYTSTRVTAESTCRDCVDTNQDMRSSIVQTTYIDPWLDMRQEKTMNILSVYMVSHFDQQNFETTGVSGPRWEGIAGTSFRVLFQTPMKLSISALHTICWTIFWLDRIVL